MKILNIEKLDLYAYKKYGWQDKIAGIGISNIIVGEALKEKSFVYLYVDKDPILYMIDPNKVIKLAKFYNSIKNVNKGVRVAIIPITSLIVVQGVSKEVKLIESPEPRSLHTSKFKTIKECQDRLEEIRQKAILKRNEIRFDI